MAQEPPAFIKAIVGLSVWAAIIWGGIHYWRSRQNPDGVTSTSSAASAKAPPASPPASAAKSKITHGPSVRAIHQTLPPKAAEAMQRGMIAVQSQDWTIAADAFETARQSAPASPEVLFNLAMAHAKAGHDLYAIAWFHAFISLDSGSPKIPKIREQITALERSVEVKLLKLAESLRQVAEQMPALYPNDPATGQWKRKTAIAKAAAIQAGAGEMSAAQRSMNDAGDMADDARHYMAVTLASGPDIETAINLADQIYKPNHDGAMNEVFWRALTCWKLDAASRIGSRWRNDNEISTARNEMEIARKVSTTDKAAAIKRVLGTAERVAASASARQSAGWQIVTMLAEFGALDEADRTFQRLQLTDDKDVLSNTQQSLASSMAAAKKLDRAIELATTIPRISNHCIAMLNVAGQCWLGGEKAKAKTLLRDAVPLAEQIDPSKGNFPRFDEVISSLTWLHAEMGNFDQARLACYRHADTARRSYALQLILHPLARAGRWREAMDICDTLPVNQASQGRTDIISGYSNSEQPAEMMQALERIKSAVTSDTYLWYATHAVPGLAKAGKLDDAIRIAESYPDVKRRVGLLASAAEVRARQNDKPGAARAGAAALKLIPSTSFEGSYYEIGYLAVAMAAAGNVDGAARLLEDTVPPGERGAQFSTLAAAVFKADPAKAAKLMDRAEALLGMIEPGPAGQQLNTLLMSLAEHHARSGNLSKSLSLAARIADTSARVTLYERLVSILANDRLDAKAALLCSQLSRECGIFSSSWMTTPYYKDLNGFMASLKSRPIQEIADSMADAGMMTAIALLSSRQCDMQRTQRMAAEASTTSNTGGNSPK